MVRKIREKQYNEIKDKSNRDIIKYFKEKSKKLRDNIKKPSGNLT